MKDMLASIEKLRADAAKAASVRDLATDVSKRALYGSLAEHFLRLAAEVERAIEQQRAQS